MKFVSIYSALSSVLTLCSCFYNSTFLKFSENHLWSFLSLLSSPFPQWLIFNILDSFKNQPLCVWLHDGTFFFYYCPPYLMFFLHLMCWTSAFLIHKYSYFPRFCSIFLYFLFTKSSTTMSSLMPLHDCILKFYFLYLYLGGGGGFTSN